MKKRMGITDRSFREPDQASKHSCRGMRSKPYKQYTYQILNVSGVVIRLNLIVPYKEVIHVLCNTQHILTSIVRNHKILNLQTDNLVIPFERVSVNVFHVTEFSKFGCRNPEFVSPNV